jgi:hypothetical protein
VTGREVCGEVGSDDAGMTTHFSAPSIVDSGSPGRAGPIRSAVLARWAADWDRWRSSPAAASAVARWRAVHGCLAGFRDVEEVLAGCGRDRSVPDAVADARLAALVAEARAGDRAAARLVLERVMPGLVRAASRQARVWRLSFGQVLDDLAAAAWVQIVRYPLARRPVKVAVNILRDAQYDLFGYVPATVRATVPAAPETLPVGPAGLSGAPVDADEPAAVELLEVLASAVRAGLPQEDGRLLAELLVFGLTPEHLGARDGLSPRTVRWRRRAAIGRLCALSGRPARSDEAVPA